MSGGQGSAPGGSGYGDGQEMNIILIAAGLVALIGGLGWLFYPQIVQATFWVKLHELKAIAFFDRAQDLQSIINWAHGIPYREVKLKDLVDLSSIVGGYLKYPFATIGVILAVLLYWRHPDNSFKAKETMDTLATKMKDTFPAIKVSQGLGLTEQDIAEGPWRMGLTPIEFAQLNKLLFKDAETGEIKVDRIRAKSLFTAQLGKPWQGVQMLEPHQKALFAIFATFMSYKRDVANDILEQIANSASESSVKAGKLNYDGIDALLKQYGNTDEIKEITTKHAYFLTVMSEMLIGARRSGIVANSLYLWVKIIDRPLWYTLNNVGRQAVYIETAAVRAHLLAENEMGYAIKAPMIDSVIDGLEEAVGQRIIRSLT